jgi:hypothetical protein
MFGIEQRILQLRQEVRSLTRDYNLNSHELDAATHIYASAVATIGYGRVAARIATDENEKTNGEINQLSGDTRLVETQERNKDFYNNYVGRELGSSYSHGSAGILMDTDGFKEQLAKDVVGLVRNGTAVVNAQDDGRVQPNTLDERLKGARDVSWGLAAAAEGRLMFSDYGGVEAALSANSDWSNQYRNNPVYNLARSFGGLARCFSAGTMILMADGARRPIERVVVGDLVMAFDSRDPGRTPLRAARVVRTFTTPFSPIWRLGDNEVGVTPTHRVFDGREGQEKELWLIAARGGSLIDSSGGCHKIAFRREQTHANLHSVPLPLALSVTATTELQCDGDLALALRAETSHRLPLVYVEDRGETATVYNFEVEGHHTYVADDWRVHNDCEAILAQYPNATGITEFDNGDGTSTVLVEDTLDGQRVAYDYTTNRATNVDTFVSVRPVNGALPTSVDGLRAFVGRAPTGNQETLPTISWSAGTTPGDLAGTARTLDANGDVLNAATTDASGNSTMIQNSPSGGILLSVEFDSQGNLLWSTTNNTDGSVSVVERSTTSSGADGPLRFVQTTTMTRADGSIVRTEDSSADDVQSSVATSFDATGHILSREGMINDSLGERSWAVWPDHDDVVRRRDYRRAGRLERRLDAYRSHHDQWTGGRCQLLGRRVRQGEHHRRYFD